nr:MAG TPA: hypothetical protein [Caudoviricetes sp.]
MIDNLIVFYLSFCSLYVFILPTACGDNVG